MLAAMSVDIKIEPVWSEEPFIVPDSGGGKITEVAEEMATQVIPSIKTEVSDPVTDGEMRKIDIISDTVSDTKTEKTTPTNEQDTEMLHSASEVLPNIRIPETEGDPRLTQSSIETVWIKQEAKDEDDIMYDESNSYEGHHTISHTDNIWDASTTGTADCAGMNGSDNNQDKGRRRKTSSKRTKRSPCNEAVPIKLDSNIEQPNILSSCEPNLPGKSDLRKRISQTTREKSYVCSVCKKSFFRRAFLSRHMEGHEENQLFFCDICGKQFKSKEALKRHIYAQHTDEVIDSTPSNNTPIGPHACNVCMKSFYRKYHLKRHMLAHSEERPYSCEICAKRFKDRHQIKAHYNNVHITQRTDLERQSISNEFLKDRLSTHNSKGMLSKIVLNGIRKRSYPCNKCTKSFDRRSRLKKHMLLHADELAYSCTVCDKRFKDRRPGQKCACEVLSELQS